MRTVHLLSVVLFVLVCSGRMSMVAQQNDLHVIVEVKEGCVIGGMRNHQWTAAEKIESSAKAPLTLTLYTVLSCGCEH